MAQQTESRRKWNAWRVTGWVGAAFLLTLPLIVGAPWTLFDFIFMGVVMAGAGLALELAVRRSDNAAYRIGIGVAVTAAFLLIWFNGAVGIIGSEDEDANLLFAAVLGMALLGSLCSLFRASGMAWAMGATALVQLLVPFITAALALAPAESIWAHEVPVLTGFFTGMWLLSAGLFRKAALDERDHLTPAS